jgi:shikimate dehydrogenase
MMNAGFQSMGIDATYEAVSIPKRELTPRFNELKARNDKGFNVTRPYKSSIMGLLDGIDDTSSRIGAVNTVSRRGARFEGFNTDVDGILKPLESRNAAKTSHALLVGAGGAARAFCEAMNRLGCRRITVAVRDPSRASEFLGQMKNSYPSTTFDLVSLEDVGLQDAELLFNASPIGSEGIPLPPGILRIFHENLLVFDAVYSPVETDLLKKAKLSGCERIYGHEMLLHQAIKAFELWTGRAAPTQVMETSLINSLEVARV